MANREKKLTAGRKQTSASPIQLKEEAEEETSSPLSKGQEKEETPGTSSSSSAVQQTPRLVNKKAALKRKDTRKIKKKTFKISLKAKTKNSKFAKLAVIAKGGKGVNVKKLNNGVAKTKIIRKRGTSKSNDQPPVLEPIYTQVNKSGKKRAPVLRSEGPSTVSETIESIVTQFSGSTRRRAQCKTMKKDSLDTVSECIEDVVNDATYIKEEDIKKEIDEDLTKTPPKKANLRKSKIERKVKKENIENTLGPTDMSDSNVIDMLDLNVRNVKSKTIEQRRHSIEKIQITNPDGKSNPHTSLFGGAPRRSVSPKIKRPAKTRSLDAKRASPYNTRLEQPARLLRNGKQRKLKKLLDGLEGSGAKKRIRSTGSEHSGSEVSFFQLSGCESDSSFSDLASTQGCENRDSLDIKDMLIKKEILETIENNAPDIVNKELPNYTQILKRSMSSETGVKSKETSDANTIDTNSNLCIEVTKEQASVKSEVASPDEAKVAEKNIILDIMKQTFNDDVVKDKDETDKRKTRSSYKKTSAKEADEEVAVPATSSAIVLKEIEIREIVVTEDKSPVNDEVKRTDIEVEEQELEEVPELVVEEEDENMVLDEKETKENEEMQVEENVVVATISSANSETENSEDVKAEIVETPENLLKKAEILKALGLQSSQAAAEKDKSRKVVPKTNAYTGTLKTVIKLNRCEKKKRNSLKMTLQKKGKSAGKDDDLVKSVEDEYKIMKDGHSTSWKSQHGGQSSDTADGSSEHTSDGDNPVNEDDATKSLVIPEKASSFSIHPDRLCKDECSYCFGKFGLFDTPCHIAQMKSIDRQNKILSTEKHLTRDSCLCDACYRHVDRKSNMPSYGGNKAIKRKMPLVAPGPKQNHCHVLGCGRISTKILRRKWLMKMKKSVCQVIDIDLNNLGLHSIPICEDHYSAIAHLMDCAMCKRRLARNHIHYLGAEANEVNGALTEIGIPVNLNDRLVCKLCRYFATLILKAEDERPENSQNFYTEYKRRLLHFHNIELMDDAQAEEPIPAPTKEKNDAKKRKIMSKSDNSSNSEPPVLEPQVVLGIGKESSSSGSLVMAGESRPDSPNDYMVDYNTLIPNIALECGGNDLQVTRKEVPKTNSSISIKRISGKSMESAMDKSKSKNKSDIAVQRLGSNPSISVRQLFPGEEELQLNAIIEFNNVKERTPEGWEKCVSTIQYDPDIKMLWQELQKPYGNQSSFLRHLILLEKYFRNGDLLLSPTASHHSVNYTESVQNRLRAYDNIRTVNPQPLPTSKPTKKYSLPAEPTITSPVKIPTPPPPPPPTSDQPSQPAKQPLIQLDAPSSGFLVPSTAAQSALTIAPSTSVVATTQSRPKLPPGLISLQPGTKIPVNSSRQKIKFPIMKDWRPNLIPIDPSQTYEKKPGLVQVISGGKPYHIALEDYKKMCAIKHKFDLHQKRKHQRPTGNVNSLLKSSPARKSLIITKASPPKAEVGSDQESENGLHVEAKLGAAGGSDMPKIPKSLTVIPQTVTKRVLRPSSPALLNKSKPNS
ncbi:PREDICTED: uncharacterized protein LOC108570030 isoform X2 [Nicrophorus vespilloides]|uniref:Uncharacterized protein LOC108570030 isoform X2 n=1 Tax=Nicrophorus vespilloides TaxID=110193 RepID=A0ABM1NKJ1_NICVS|nr:PREDICTED: uncharacterized protein LOC108570030 isoform X2 [Nicrophorus vespilloides]